MAAMNDDNSGRTALETEVGDKIETRSVGVVFGSDGASNDASLHPMSPGSMEKEKVVEEKVVEKQVLGLSAPAVYFCAESGKLGFELVYLLTEHPLRFYDKETLEHKCPLLPAGSMRSMVSISDEVKSFVVETNVLVPEKFMSAIAQGDIATLTSRPHFLRYLKENGLLNENALSVAAFNGQMSSVKWLLEQKCPVTLRDIRSAIETKASLSGKTWLTTDKSLVDNYFEILQVLVNEFPANDAKSASASDIISLAVKSGYVAAASFLYSYGFQWANSTGRSTLFNYCGTIEMAEFLLSIGVSVSDESLRLALMETVNEEEVWFYLWKKAIADDPTLVNREQVLRRILLASCIYPRPSVMQTLLLSSPKLCQLVANPETGKWAVSDGGAVSAAAVANLTETSSPLIQLVHWARLSSLPVDTKQLIECCQLLIQTANCPVDFKSKPNNETVLHVATKNLKPKSLQGAKSPLSSSSSSITDAKKMNDSSLPALDPEVIMAIVDAHLSLPQRENSGNAESLWNMKTVQGHTAGQFAVFREITNDLLALSDKARANEKKLCDARVEAKLEQEREEMAKFAQKQLGQMFKKNSTKPTETDKHTKPAAAAAASAVTRAIAKPVHINREQIKTPAASAAAAAALHDFAAVNATVNNTKELLDEKKVLNEPPSAVVVPISTVACPDAAKAFAVLNGPATGSATGQLTRRAKRKGGIEIALAATSAAAEVEAGAAAGAVGAAGAVTATAPERAKTKKVKVAASVPPVTLNATQNQ